LCSFLISNQNILRLWTPSFLRREGRYLPHIVFKCYNCTSGDANIFITSSKEGL
jgi:hypothetical protein